MALSVYYDSGFSLDLGLRLYQHYCILVWFVYILVMKHSTFKLFFWYLSHLLFKSYIDRRCSRMLRSQISYFSPYVL